MAAWCRIGVTGVEAGSDLLTALVPGELARRFEVLLPGAQVVALTEGPGPLPVELDPLSRRRAEVDPADFHVIAPPDLLDAGLDLLADGRLTDPDSQRWREMLPVRGELGDGPVVIVEVGAGATGEEAGTVLVVDPAGGSAAVAAAPPGVAAVEPHVAAGLLLDAYLHASAVVAASPGGRRLATPVDAERVVAATAAVEAVADRAFGEVVRRDGAAAARRQLTAWACWGRAVDAARRAAEDRHRRHAARPVEAGEGA